MDIHNIYECMYVCLRLEFVLWITFWALQHAHAYMSDSGTVREREEGDSEKNEVVDRDSGFTTNY